MTTRPNGPLQQYALLIGVDCYLPHQLPDGSHYPSLHGCVRDITQVEACLTHTLSLPREHILKLTASHTDAPEPPEPRDQWPTYAHIVAAFQQLTSQAQPGDHVYIHYSGHGGRTPTKFPDLKGAQGLDETLVPTDIGDATTRHLRDLELAYLLKRMVDKGLLVTLVLDSCHSGGATRGTGEAVPRGIQSIDTTPRPMESLVASDADLLETWRRVSARTTRTIRVGSGWLLEPQGYVLLAACRASESAYEYAFDGKERHGVLTYWLLDSLQQLGPGCTYKTLYDRILAKVHSQFAPQTPQLEGEGHRVVFGSEQRQHRYAAVVMQVDPAASRVWVNVGQAHGVRQGARLVVYPLATTDFTRVDSRLALVEITELGATDSWATITHRLRADPIDQGAQAVLLEAGPTRLRRTLRLVRQECIPPTIDQDAALQHVARACTQSGSGFVGLAGDGEPADYQVVVNARREYEVWDPIGHVIANLRPALCIDDRNAPARLVQRLEHLTRYHNVQELDNRDPFSPLAHKLVVELVGEQSDYDPVDLPQPQPFVEAGHPPTLKDGAWTFVRVRNDSAQVLNVTVLDLQPDWGITQIYPTGAGFFVPLDPGQELPLLPLRASLPPGSTKGTDVMKIFATVGATNFRQLELPALDHPLPQRARTRGGLADPLDALLAAMSSASSQTRNLALATSPSREWVTAHVEVGIQRPGPHQA